METPIFDPYLRSLDRFYWALRPHAMDYFRVLDHVHQHVRPRTYLEIGVFTGASMTLSLPGTLNVGVDPNPQISWELGSRTKIFTETSDSFFEAHDLGEILEGMPLDLAFIDGMHHFEFALRDFINVERRATPNTVVLIHDCYPMDAVTASRERSTAEWSGDTWKLIVCLKERRPDLKVSVVDVGPSGLGVVTGLDPANTLLEEHYDEIEPHYRSLEFGLLEGGAKATVLNRVPNEWSAVRTLLPERPFRTESIARLVTRRDVQAGWSFASKSAAQGEPFPSARQPESLRRDR